MRSIFGLLFMLCAIQTVYAEEMPDTLANRVNADLKVDFVSRHIWRGIINNSSPSVQPTMYFKFGNFNIGAWASYSLAKENMQEIDLFLGYTIGPVSISIYDYYNPIDTLGWKGDFLHFKSSNTRHTLESIITYTGTVKFPIQMLVAVMFYGYDKDELGNNLYSTYFETGYKFDFKQIEIYPHIGFTPFKGYYSKSTNIINVGLTLSKVYKITDNIKIPLRSSFIINPNQNKAYVIIGVTI